MLIWVMVTMGWFGEMAYDAWDLEMQRDFSPGGRGEHLVELIDRELDAEESVSFEEGLRRFQENNPAK